MNADWKVEKAQYAELNVPTCGKIAVCQLCRERQPFWNSHDGLDQCHGVRSHEFTPHAPCCQESDSRSTWDALALRATSRCLFTHPIPERRHWRHFWTSKETPSWALALEQAFAPWTAVWPLPPRQGATFCLDHLFFLGQFGLMVCSGRSLRHDNLWKVCAHPPCTLLPGKQYCRSTWDAGPRGYQQVFIHNWHHEGDLCRFACRHQCFSVVCASNSQDSPKASPRVILKQKNLIKQLLKIQVLPGWMGDEVKLSRRQPVAIRHLVRNERWP